MCAHRMCTSLGDQICNDGVSFHTIHDAHNKECVFGHSPYRINVTSPAYTSRRPSTNSSSARQT